MRRADSCEMRSNSLRDSLSRRFERSRPTSRQWTILSANYSAGFATQQDESRTSHPQRPAQKRLVKALSAPLSSTIVDQYHWRDKAIDAVTAYCAVEEGNTVRQRQTLSSTSATCSVSKHEPPAESVQHAAPMSVLVKYDNEMPRRCFICVGRALNLSPEDPAIAAHTREFYTSGDLNKHFHRSHLSNIRKNDVLERSFSWARQ